MTLVKIVEFYPNYKDEIFGGEDIKGFEVYSENNEKIGWLYDTLVDVNGRFRYFIINVADWAMGKKILLPVGFARMDYDQKRIYARGLTKKQVESMPKYEDTITLDYDYEERVRNIYRPIALEAGGNVAAVNQSDYTSETYSYDYEPTLYQINEDQHKVLKLYEERLLTNKERFKTGEVAVGKRIETETEHVAVPIEKERVIIERSQTSEAREVEPGSVDFNEGEVARMEVYEESADIKKKAYVREEVGIRKEVEQDSVEAEETLRREELEVDVQGQPVIKHEREESTGW